MFTGEYRHNLDNKNRLAIPSKIRNLIGDNIVITRGLDGCLFGYDLKTFDKLIEKLNSLPFTKKDVRSFTRFFASSAITLEFDKQGRVLLPSYLIEHAGIEKNCVVVGVMDRIEIWSETKWDSFINDNIESLSDISENLFDNINESL